MLRRSFLGVAIGSMMATRLPFIAKPHLLPFTKGLTAQQNIDLVRYHAEDLDLFYVIGNDFEIIRTTPVLEMRREYDKVVFQLEPWMVTVEKLPVHYVGYSYHGSEIFRTKLNVGTLNRNDTLKCQYTLSWG